MAVEAKKEVVKKKLAPKVVGLVDITDEDVLKYNEEGRILFFLDEEDTFRELAPETVKQLSLVNREHYDVAKSIAGGQDVIGNVQDAIAGFDTDAYNVRPGSASANLAVYGKDPNFDYYWERAENISKSRADGWEVDHDPNVKTKHKESCTYKTVGGQAKPEMILTRRSKKASAEHKKKQREKRDRLIQHAQDTVRESAAQLGVKTFDV